MLCFSSLGFFFPSFFYFPLKRNEEVDENGISVRRRRDGRIRLKLQACRIAKIDLRRSSRGLNLDCSLSQ